MESANRQSGWTSFGKMITAYLNQSSVEGCLKILLLPVMNELQIPIENHNEKMEERALRGG